MTDDADPANACCDGGSATCIFARALLARAASCELATRRSLAEHDLVECPSPPARTRCDTLAALLHERSRFALHLPRAGRPLLHAQALRLQCGGLAALQQALQAGERDVHRLVGLAHERHGSLTGLPWGEMVAGIVDWQPRRRRRAP